MSITQSQLAERLGVSQGTISYAFTPGSKIRPDTRMRVLQAARELGYRPSSAARAMVSRKTRHIGVVIHSLGLGASAGHHAYDTVSGVNSIIEPAGYTTCLVQMTDVEAGEDGLARVFREQALDGMIVHAALMPEVSTRIGELVQKVIWCDAGIEQELNCIWRDEHEAGRLVGRAVLDAGFREAVFFHGPRRGMRPYWHRERREQGVRSVIEPAGGRVLCRELPDDPISHLDRWADQVRPDRAVIACGHTDAEVLFTATASLGRPAGWAYALACCDDRGWYAHRFNQLSRAVFDRFAMGRCAAEMMLDLLDDASGGVPSRQVRPVWHPGILEDTSLRPTLTPLTSLGQPISAGVFS